MAAKKKLLKAKTSVKRPSARAMKVAEHLLEVPELMAAAAQQMQQMAAQLDRMEHSIRVLHALVMVPDHAATRGNLLTEPAPEPAAPSLLEEFKNEPKGNIP
jgi:hypothetical protein